MQLSVTMTIKKGGDFMKLPPEPGYLSSQWRREGDSQGQGRREGESVGPVCGSPGHRKEGEDEAESSGIASVLPGRSDSPSLATLQKTHRTLPRTSFTQQVKVDTRL